MRELVESLGVVLREVPPWRAALLLLVLSWLLPFALTAFAACELFVTLDDPLQV